MEEERKLSDYYTDSENSQINKEDTNDISKEESIKSEAENIQSSTQVFEESEETEEKKINNKLANIGQDDSLDTKKNRLQAFTESTYKEVEEAEKIAKEAIAKKKIEEEKNRIEKAREEEYKDNIIEPTHVESKKENTDESTVHLPNMKNIRTVKTDNIYQAFGEQMQKRRETLFSTKVPLPLSGYTASIIGMSSPDIRDYSETLAGLDRYGKMELKYRTVFERIIKTSAGPALDSFDDFLKGTALMEFDILMFGLFSSSFPEKNTYPFRCQNENCKANMEFTYYNKQFLDTKEEDLEKREQILSSIRNVIMGQSNGEETFRTSEVSGKIIRKTLKHSKIIVELRHPTLYDHLYDVMKYVPQGNVEHPTLVNLMPFIRKVYYPTIDTVMNDEPDYLLLTDFDQKIQALSCIDQYDDEDLATAIDEILSKYQITFTLRTPKCKSCGAGSIALPVDFEEMLFTMQQIQLLSKNR